MKGRGWGFVGGGWVWMAGGGGDGGLDVDGALGVPMSVEFGGAEEWEIIARGVALDISQVRISAL